MSVTGRVVYWLAVIAISLALVVGLITLFESQDPSTVPGPGALTVIRAFG